MDFVLRSTAKAMGEEGIKWETKTLLGIKHPRRKCKQNELTFRGFASSGCKNRFEHWC